MNYIYIEKFDFINLLVYRIQHQKKSKELSSEFLILFDIDVLIISPNFVIWDIAFRLYSLIVLSFLDF